MLRVGEFFSGIGAMHLALSQLETDPRAKVVIAFDINQVANATYEHNFGLKPTTRLVEHLSIEYFERLQLDGWLLSPPCQPFTRGGNMRDHLDERSAGLLHLIRVLQEMQNPPKLLFLENVLNFEVSECRNRLVEALGKRGFQFEEYLISPMDIGIPNDRLRYYLIARRGSSNLCISDKIIQTFSELDPPANVPEISKVGDYLEQEADLDESLLIPQRYITDYKNYKHDIVHPESRRSTTFTKAYGSDYIIGVGSFLQTRRPELTDYQKDDPELLMTLGLRFFSPREVARLHAFPESFAFAPGTTRIQQYRLLGNSMNVQVVSILLNRLLHHERVSLGQ